VTAPPPDPRARAATTTDWSGLRAAIAAIARDTGRDGQEAWRDALGHLRELRTAHSRRVHGWWVRAGRALIGRGYAHIDYDPVQVERVRSLLSTSPAVVLSSHRSYLDGGALTVGFHDHGLPPLTVFGGINMAFWPLGALWRRNGMVFIRRAGDDPVYRCTLRHYLAWLVGQRRPLQWFIEGTRSRTGKLGPPRLGLLTYLADACREGSLEDLQLLPVSVSYDQLQEVAEYAAEARGASKTAESLGWLIRYVRAQRGRFGSVYVRFGEPLSLRAALGEDAPDRAAAPAERRRALQKLALEVSLRINDATPVTGAALVTLALLGARGRALTLPQIRLAVAGYLDFARRRGLPVAATAALGTDAAVRAVLEGLVAQGVTSGHAAGREPVYVIAAEQHLAAAYYRNTIAHFFLLGAIGELASLAAARQPPDAQPAAFDEEALALRDLLKFDFFLLDRPRFVPAVRAELDRLAPSWAADLQRGPPGAEALLERMPTLASDMLLRSFVEAYRVAVDTADSSPGCTATGPLLEACLGLGRQYLLQGRLRTPESVSGHLYRAGLDLLRHRAAVGAGPEFAARRRALAAQLDDVLHRLGTVHRIAVRRVERGLSAAGPPDDLAGSRATAAAPRAS
jgi:glycerol-3-phosphate O-acyltransferase